MEQQFEVIQQWSRAEGGSDQPKVSVLTPIYNVSGYLAQCIESLKAQTLTDIEFICINDGSTDNSLEILRELAANDSRFTIVTKPNSGYGASMNIGLDLARGEYIGVLESDDWASPRMFEDLYALAADNDADIVRSNRFDLTDESDTYNELLAGLPYGQVFRPVDVPGIFEPAPCIWAQIYRKGFLEDNSIRFLETPGASFQDTGFVYKSYIAADRMILTQEAYLHYRMDNMGSSVKSDSKVYCVVDEFTSIDKYLENYPDRYEMLSSHYEALRYQAYNWNYNRLGRQTRHEFIRFMAKDLQDKAERGLLDESVFSARDWDRIQGLLQNVEEQFEKECPVVSVIVPAYNCERHLEDTIKSLVRQPIRNIEIIIVNDGSTDSTREVAEKCVKLDRRVCLINQDNLGLSGARNTGMRHAFGKYLSFIDAEDTVPAGALESLVRSMEAEDADLVVGIIEEFDPVRQHQFEKTVDLAQKRIIERYDTDLVSSLSVNNKLFKRALVEKLGLTFRETFAEDVAFSLEYILNCGKIVGCNCVVLNYRRDLLWDQLSLTAGAKESYVHGLITAHERGIKIAEEALDRDYNNCGDEITRRKLALLKLTYTGVLHRRLVSYLIDLQYRHLWLYSDEIIDLIRKKVQEHRAFVPDADWANTCNYHSDLPIAEGMPGKDKIAKMPLITIVITKELSGDDIPLVLNAIYHNRFPRFEVLVPVEQMAFVPEFYREIGNLHLIEETSDNAMCKERALGKARSPLIMYIDQRLIPHVKTLFNLWAITKNSQADFVSCYILNINRKKEVRADYKSQRILFDKPHCKGYSYADPLNRLDCSMGNKLIKVNALKDEGFVFGETAYEDCDALYELLSFQKSNEVEFLTDVPESQFLKNAEKHLIAAIDPVFIVNRLANQGARKRMARKALRLRDKVVNKTAKLAHDKQEQFGMPTTLAGGGTVVFFSNRGLTGSLKCVYDALDIQRKKLFAETLPHSDAYDRTVCKALRRASVIVTDDYCQYLRDVHLKPNQHVVQLWHACGAFKKFGLDNLRVDPDRERAAHRQYDAAIVSSDFVRPIYAGAFGIPESKVLALGVPRTDALLDKEANEAICDDLLERHPGLVGKRVYLYAPTFRQHDGVQSTWDPCIDWERLSAQMEDDEVFVVKPHPLERFDLLDGLQLPNILRLEDESTDTLLRVAKVLISDYSSIIFDAVMLEIPTAFWCPDLKEYQTGFYVQFPEDLCGDLVEREEDLLPALRGAARRDDQAKMYTFRRKHLEACDGNSTQRVVEYIQSLL